MPERIDSPANARIKALVRLRSRRERERTQRFSIEGAREVARALDAGLELREAYLCPSLFGAEGVRVAERLAQAGIGMVSLSEAAFAKASLRDTPDGVLAVAPIPPAIDLEALFAAEALLLILAGLEKPGNIGALLRSADGAAVDGVLVTGAGTDLFNPNVIRASMGSVFTVPVLPIAEQTLLARIRGWQGDLVAAHPESDTLYWDVDLRGPVAIVLGSEHAGLAGHWREAADTRVAIPMSGVADSLNVATAGTLLLYEALRQRRG